MSIPRHSTLRIHEKKIKFKDQAAPRSVRDEVYELRKGVQGTRRAPLHGYARFSWARPCYLHAREGASSQNTQLGTHQKKHPHYARSTRNASVIPGVTKACVMLSSVVMSSRAACSRKRRSWPHYDGSAEFPDGNPQREPLDSNKSMETSIQHLTVWNRLLQR